MVGPLNNHEECQVCGVGYLHLKQAMGDVNYLGVTRGLLYYFSVCDVCEVEQVGRNLLKTNKDIMLDFKNKVENNVITKA